MKVSADVGTEIRKHILEIFFFVIDRLCGLVVRVPGYRSKGLGSIPGATRFSE
jgi:hypothetical protein